MYAAKSFILYSKKNCQDTGHLRVIICRKPINDSLDHTELLYCMKMILVNQNRPWTTHYKTHQDIQALFNRDW